MGEARIARLIPLCGGDFVALALSFAVMSKLARAVEATPPSLEP